MKITLLVGHRGVGKTRLLNRIEKYLEGQVQIFDLDTEIERHEDLSISDIFSKESESCFRKLEEQVLLDLVSQCTQDAYVSLGAGYIGKIPEGAEVLWVRRETDDNGRIFLDRPRLNSEISALEEYLERFSAREKHYQQISTKTLVLREGLFERLSSERSFFSKPDGSQAGFTTLMPGESVDVHFCKKLELRDDLFSKEELEDICNELSPDRMLFSYRNSKNEFRPPEGCETDWALELGEPKHGPTVISCHERLPSESLQDFFKRLSKYGDQAQLKAAPQIETFEDLLVGHLWQQEAPDRRSFLPMSDSGRWKWYRLLMKGRCPLNFYRSSNGSAKDQPTLLEWLDAVENPIYFAAVLGSPVTHSHTPTEHLEFFREYRMPVLALDISEDEFDIAIPVLRKLGLKCAAVTSPLKKKAFSIATHKTDRAEDWFSANTLFFAEGEIYADNTDGVGLQALRDQADLSESISVFGGGGTLGPLRSVFPDAEFISARTGTPRDHEGLPAPPKTLVLAGQGELPPTWKPETLIDLSYTENSQGLEFALRFGSRYINGHAMFKAQAQEQRKFWQPLLESD